MRSGVKFDRLTLGVCYYPEHWSEDMWEPDLKRMLECGISVIRIAEFAWNKFEPEEGVYTFGFFDKFMELARSMGMKVIFCTPTATAPVWMSEKYPEILNRDIDGNVIYNGMRRQNNLTSPVYREFAAKICEKLAARYCAFENVIGWQLDNEINCEATRYYSESDHLAFREYLKNKFTDIDTLNKRMGTVFWNQTYNSFDEVYLTRRTNSPGETNPHMKLEELRFISYSVAEFFKLQSDIIKKYRRPDQFITTNGIFPYIDYHKLVGGTLDFICYDNYPNFAFELGRTPDNGNGFNDRNSSYNLTVIRSISQPFGIMEQQSGGGGWNCKMMQPMPKPGQMRLWTYQALAHAADFISYFRWRTAPFGTEIYWHGLNDHSNKPNRRMAELETISEEIKRLSSVCGTRYKAEVAIIKDHDNEWDRSCDIWHERIASVSDDSWFRALQRGHIPYNYVYINDDTDISELAGYTHIIYPHPDIMTRSRARLLALFSARGGTIIFGCRSGIKDINGKCFVTPQPGSPTELCGCEVEEFTLISAFDDRVKIDCGGEAVIYNEVLRPTDGEVVGTFRGSHYSGRPAIVRKGTAYYVGSAFDMETATALSKMTGMKPAAEDTVSAPPEVEIAVRADGTKEYVFALNYKSEDINITLKKPCRELISGEVMKEAVKLPPYGCMIFTA